MNRFECPDCGMEFVADASAASCPKCGYACIASLPEIVKPEASGEAAEREKALPAVREVLRSFCSQSYDMTFQGPEWEALVDEALEELRPYLKA